MTQPKTMAKSEATRPATNVNADQISRAERLAVHGVRLCVSECQSPQQIMDACEEEIRELAYLKWEEAGCPSGEGFDFWVEAEREVIAARSGTMSLDA